MASVSFIIPLINEAENVTAAVESAWLAGANEVIVVDGGSTDGTLEIARGLECELLHSTAGRAVQQNMGAAAARSEILFFQHADTHLAATGAEQIASAVGNGAQCGGFVQAIEGRGLRYRLLEWGNAARVRRLGAAYGDQGIFVTRELFDAVGGFPEVPLLEDLLLLRNLRQHAWPVLLDGPLHISARRWRENGVIRQTLRNWLILSLHCVGVSPQALSRLYARHDRTANAAHAHRATSEAQH